MYLFSIWLFGWLIQGLYVNSNKIWLIRHCDKPSKTESPCCSARGYLRAEAWSNYFATRATQPLYYISSGYRQKQECINDFYVPEKGDLNSDCPKSQRMFITSYIIQQSLREEDVQNQKEEMEGEKEEGEEGEGAIENMNTQFCVGQESSLVDFVLRKRGEKGDILITWEHSGIVEILRHMGFDISKWKNHMKEHYELVFWVDLDIGTWGYECYDFEVSENDGDEQPMKCSKSVIDWLGTNRYNNSAHGEVHDFIATRILMIMVMGFLIGCGIGLVVFLIMHYVENYDYESKAFFRKMPVYGV